MAVASKFLIFRSFRSRLIVFLLALLVPVLGGIFYYVNANNTEYTEETINRYLQLGADVFDYTRLQQANTLQAITNSLTWDFGFRTAYAANDPATLFDAALNVLDRSMESADMLMIVDLDNQVIIDTELQGMDSLEGYWLELITEADASEEGRAERVVTIAERPYQLIALPLYLPRQVAWIIGGFGLDAEFVNQVRETVVSEVSIVRVTAGDVLEVTASSLSGERQSALAQQLNLEAAGSNTLQRIRYGDEEFTTLQRRLVGDASDAEQVLAIIQRSYDENNENVVQFQQLLIQFYLVILLISLIAVLILARSISNPLQRLAQVVTRIEKGDYVMQAEVRSRDELGLLAGSVNSMAQGLAEKEKVRDLLGKVVSHQIAEELLSNPVELGGEERVATILFSDIRGFTSYCEGMPPQQVLEALNKVLTAISDIIERHQGVVDKYQGDAVMALFGAPVQGDNDASNAMAAALEIVEAVGGEGSGLSACVGINTGLVVAGNLGSSNRLNYSVIGDTVNLAARLEGLTRLYSVPNIVSEASMQAAPEFVYRALDEVRVAGKQEAIRIFELVGKASTVSESMKNEVRQFELALNAYRQQAWADAERGFSQLLKTCDNTQLYQVYLDRIDYFKHNPPASDWRGIYTFDKK